MDLGISSLSKNLILLKDELEQEKRLFNEFKGEICLIEQIN